MVKKWIITAATFGGKKIASLHEKKKRKKNLHLSLQQYHC